MDAEVKARWLTALRSGEYEQGKKLLSHAGRYCCLGVLAKEQGWLRAGKVDGSKDILPDAREEEVGLMARDTVSLMGMNDVGKSFAEIADWIEANL